MPPSELLHNSNSHADQFRELDRPSGVTLDSNVAIEPSGSVVTTRGRYGGSSVIQILVCTGASSAFSTIHAGDGPFSRPVIRYTSHLVT